MVECLRVVFFCPCGGVTDLNKPYWRKTSREARKSADEFNSNPN
jgi:hypothetical protein